MTQQNDNLGDDLEEEGGNKGRLVKILAMAGVMLLIAGISVGGTLFLTGFFADEPVVTESGEPGQQQARPPTRALYLQLNPDFVVTYDVGSRQRFLRVELAVRARDQASLDALTQHMPLVRDEIITTLSEQTFGNIQRREGKEELVETLAEVMNRIITQRSEGQGVEAVLYNNFVLQ